MSGLQVVLQVHYNNPEMRSNEKTIVLKKIDVLTFQRKHSRVLLME
jgi:hypothetical protein